MDARDAGEEVYFHISLGCKCIRDGNFIKTSFARMWSALPRVEIPKAVFLDLKLADFLC